MSSPLVALALFTVASAEPRSTVALQTIPFELPRTAVRSTDEREVNLLVSSAPEVLSRALEQRGFAPLDGGACGEAHAIDGRPPELAFVADASCEDGFRTELWLYPRTETPRRLPFYAGVAVERPCMQLEAECGAECLPAFNSAVAVERVLGALAYGLSQTREAVWTADGSTVAWVQLESPPRQARAGEEDVAAAAPAIAPQVIETIPAATDRVALTFDACSTFDNYSYDAQAIDVLEKEQVPATLFVSGRWALAHPEEMARLSKNPLFEIGNHAYIHPKMLDIPTERMRDELLFTQRVLFGFTGKLPRYFRPPYGVHNDALVLEAAKLGLVTVEYDVASGDSDKAIAADKLTAWVIEKSKSGSVVVLHMNGKGVHTAASLPEMIKGLREKGLTPSQVGQMVQATKVHTAKAVP